MMPVHIDCIEGNRYFIYLAQMNIDIEIYAGMFYL